MTHRFATLAAAVSAGAVLLGAQAQAAETIKMTFVSGHPPIFTWSKHYLATLIPTIDRELAKTGKYKIEWNKAFGGALAKAGDELEVIEEGLADIGQSLSGFEPAKMPLQNVGFYAPFQPTAPNVSALVIQDLQKEIPAMGGVWERYNQVYLGGGIAADVYNIWSNFPIKTVDDIKGKKIGGAPPSATFINGTGGVFVVSGMSDNYNNVKTGLIDGIINFVTGSLPSKYHEVAPYVTVVNFGSPFFGGIAINKDRWTGFPQEVRAAVQTGVDVFEKTFHGELDEKIAAAWKTQKSLPGSTVYELPEAERVRWANLLPPLGKQWAADMEAKGLPGRQVLEGYMNGMRKRGYDFPRAWDKE